MDLQETQSMVLTLRNGQIKSGLELLQ